MTKAPEIDGVHFVHAMSCQGLPDQEMEDPGEHETCDAAVVKAGGRDDPLNASALCCPDCYDKG